MLLIKSILSRLLVLVLLFAVSYGITAQEIVAPILLNKAVLSGIGLQKIDLKNEPEKDFYQKNLYRGPELSVYVVSTANWTNEMKDFPFDEYVYMLHGEAVIQPEHGPAEIFQSHEHFFAPKGYNGTWQIRGGNHLHYELSVIATQRAEASDQTYDHQHKRLNLGSTSGTQITPDQEGYYQEVLATGPELTVSIIAERPQTRQVAPIDQEQLIHILSGMITIKLADESEHDFYTGDFVMLPDGMNAQWTSKGHGLLKYLRISKT